MAEFLKNIDSKLFQFINSHYCSSCDFIFYWASDRWIWIPFYIFLLYAVYKNSGKETFKIILSIAVLILLTDQVSVFVKDHVMRYRPCHNLILQSQIHLVNNYCGGQYGFVSSHAANSSGLALFLFFLFRKKINLLSVFIFSWCLLVSYSRIYLGQHYPTDVFGGWIVGFVSAWIIFYFYKKYFLTKTGFESET